MNKSSLRLSSLKKETPLQASKWQRRQLLIDAGEMESLFQALEPFEIYHTGCVCDLGQDKISKDEFLDNYRLYVNTLKRGELPVDSVHRSFFSSVFTRSANSLYAVFIGERQQLIRVARPIVQLQPHNLGFSAHDKKFRPMLMGANSIPWGIQFSYPQLFFNQELQRVEKTRENKDLINTALFDQLQRWIRCHTIPTPCFNGDKVVHIPVRLGKQCLSWINSHPKLKEKGLFVERTC